MARGSKVGGARFYYLTGDGAFLQLGMMMLAAQKAREAGFQLMVPPVLVRPEIMSGTGFLGEHADEIYYLERDDMYLVGTSEVALAGYHAMPAGRRVSAGKPVRTARTPAVFCACISSTRWKCSATASLRMQQPNTRLC